MLRNTLIAIALLLAFAIVVYALLPLPITVPAAGTITVVNPGQEAFAGHLELGLIYEQDREWAKAAEQYEEAAVAAQPDIVAAAQDGLQRVLDYQNNPWLSWQTQIREWLSALGRLLLIGLIVAGVILSLSIVIIRLRPRSGYRVMPFTDYTNDEIGKGFHALVVFTIQEARIAHAQSPDNLLKFTEYLELPQFVLLDEVHDSVSPALAAMDAFTVGGVQLPFGKTLTAFQQWFGSHKYSIVGNVNQAGDLIVARALIRDARTGETIEEWNLNSTADATPSEQVAELADRLAFRLIYKACPDVAARNWLSLQLFTYGIRDASRFGTEATSIAPLQSAAASLKEAVRLDPDYRLAHYWLGLVANSLGHYALARDEFRIVIQTPDNLVAPATYNLGLAFYQEFKPWANEQANANYNKIPELIDAKEPNVDEAALLALSHCGIAAVLAQSVKPGGNKASQLNAVEEQCEKALSLSGENIEVVAAVHYARGLAHLKARQYDAAVESLQAAVSAKPAYPTAYIHLAEAHLKRGEEEQAILAAGRAIDWRPDYAYAHMLLGRIYAGRQDMEQAKAEYALAAGLPDAHNSLGELLAAESNFSAALEQFHKAVGLNNNHSRGWRNLAWWTVESGRYDEESLFEATQWAQRSVQLEEGTNFQWLSEAALGWVLFHRDRLEQAEEHLRMSIESCPNGNTHIQNRYLLARVLLAKGQADEAEQTLAEALTLPEDNLWRDKAVNLLRQLRREQGDKTS